MIVKPVFVEYSLVPVFLSLFTPIEINAITLGWYVFSRGKLDAVVKQHESIHVQQYVETFFIGFVLIYFWDYLKGYIKYRDGKKAYMQIRFEQEAYGNQRVMAYLTTRPAYSWRKYTV